MSPRRLLVLLPVRNGATDLDRWFASVEQFADGVIALDDGSTDSTLERLRSHPLVLEVLTHPVRQAYEGWDDALNRQRLLEAAQAHAPDWILSLDVDEALHPEDAAALRTFVDRDALEGFAFGLQIFRMVDDELHYDPRGLWIYRLFSYEPGQRFPQRKLHFVPVPTSIPRRRWLRTTLRVQHFGSLTPERRAHRYAKYEEVDPQVVFQDTYEHLLDAPGEVRIWPARDPNQPILHAAEDEDSSDDAVVLSAVVISQNDEDTIAQSVKALVEQEVNQPFEIIVVTSGTDRTAAVVRASFPGVKVVELSEPALPGKARNAGWRQSSGEYVTFPGSHVVLPQGSLQARLDAHEDGWAMVTGTTLNGNDSPAGWASYFLDHSTVLPGRPSGELSGPPGHCSYMSHHLEQVGGFPENMRAGEDTVVNTALYRRGHAAYRAAGASLIHASRAKTSVAMARHHFGRGRAWGKIILDREKSSGRLLARKWGDLRKYPKTRYERTEANVRRWGGDLEPRFDEVVQLVKLGIGAATLGLWFELLRPEKGKFSTLVKSKRHNS